MRYWYRVLEGKISFLMIQESAVNVHAIMEIHNTSSASELPYNDYATKRSPSALEPPWVFLFVAGEPIYLLRCIFRVFVPL